MGFLNGITVVDLSQMVSRPVATMYLEDMGTDVIKVERPETRDLSRNLQPFVDGASSQFMALNRNKRSIEVDLQSDRGQSLVTELLKEADVFVENYKAGTVEGFGPDYDTVSATKPDIVYCSIKGFASRSIYEGNPAYNMIAQAMSGSMSITGGTASVDRLQLIAVQAGISRSASTPTRCGRSLKASVSSSRLSPAVPLAATWPSASLPGTPTISRLTSP